MASTPLRTLRQALRALVRTPGSTALGVAALTLGVGGTVAFFAVLDAAYLRPLPFPDSERLVRLLDAVPVAGGGSYLANLVPREVAFLAARARSFERIACQRAESFTLLGAGDPAELPGASLSPGSLELLGIQPVLGRGFSAAELEQGEASGVVLVSHRLWRERFAADPAILGRAIRLGGRMVTVVGVAPAAFRFPYHADIWQPLRLDPSDERDLLVIGRLRPGVSVAAARTEMAALAAEYRGSGASGAAERGGPGLAPAVVPLREELLREQQRTATGLFAAAALFLLVACANVAALLLARAMARRQDFAIRSALGAGPLAQLVAIFAEPALMAATSALLALAALRLAAPALSTLVPQVLSEELGFEPVRLDVRLIVFTILVAAASALLAGLAPALRVQRGEVAPLLGGARTAGLGGRHRVLRALLGVEVAVLCLLLVAAAALIAGFVRSAGRRLGFEPRGVLAIEIHAPASRYEAAGKLRRLAERLQEEVGHLPGTTAAVSTINPLRGAIWGVGVRRPESPPAETTEVNLRLVSPGIFSTLRLALVRGRDFAARDADGPPSVIVSRRLAQRLWAREDVVGESLVRAGARGPVTMTVVGVADDVADAGDLRETLYLPFAQTAAPPAASDFWIMARGAGEREGWRREVERAMWRVDSELAWSELGRMDEMHAAATSRERLATRLAALCAAFALLLAGLGLGGVTAFILGQRNVELGVRMALGADRRRLLGALVAEGLALTAAGVVSGVAAFWVLRPLLRAVVPGVDAPPAAALAAVVGLVLVVAALASYLPARRVVRGDVLAALREP